MKDIDAFQLTAAAAYSTMRFEPVGLEEFVRSTLAGLAPRLDEACVSVGMDVVGTVVARADREKLRQVLVNLVQNAIDAMADQPAPRQLGVAITLANGTARLRVSDTGGGIPAGLLPHVFEPFRSGKAQGTGLGLAIVKQIIDAHRGHIAVTSQLERGTVVTVELPVIERAA